MQAILITAYKNFSHLEDIIRFFDEDFSIYIHLDKKSKFTQEQIERLKTKRTVKYVIRKYSVNWGGINHLLAILDLMQEARQSSENDFFQLITGHDYPIKNLQYLKDFYKENKNNNFMEYHPLPYLSWNYGGLDRLEEYNIHNLFNIKKKYIPTLAFIIQKTQKVLHIKRSFYDGFPRLYGGSTYWSMSKEAIEYIFHYIAKNPQYIKRFKYTFCSEEIFFQTILLNSKLKDKIVNNNLRFIVWERRNGNCPANLDRSDLDRINASDALFARKFEFPISQSLLNDIKKNYKGLI